MMGNVCRPHEGTVAAAFCKADKLGDLPLVITNGIHAALDHICHMPVEMPADTMLRHTVSVP